MAALLNERSFVCSDNFYYVYPFDALAYLQEQDEKSSEQAKGEDEQRGKHSAQK